MSSGSLGRRQRIKQAGDFRPAYSPLAQVTFDDARKFLWNLYAANQHVISYDQRRYTNDLDIEMFDGCREERIPIRKRDVDPENFKLAGIFVEERRDDGGNNLLAESTLASIE